MLNLCRRHVHISAGLKQNPFQEGDPRNFYDSRSIEIRVKFALRRKISTRDNLLREKVSQGVLYYGLGSYTTGQNL